VVEVEVVECKGNKSSLNFLCFVSSVLYISLWFSCSGPDASYEMNDDLMITYSN
jgi:hypothetical protein